MDTVLMNYPSGDYKHRMGNPNWSFHTTNRTLYPHPSNNLLLASFLANKHLGGGNFMSLPPPNVFRSPHNFQHRGQQPPPLLPLPISIPRNNQTMSMNNIARSNSTTTTNNNIRLSPPKINKKNVKNRGRDHSVTPKKSKTQKKDQKKDEPEIVGPDPKDLPKVDLISKVFSSSINNIDKFSGSVVFTPSPPPSSLPLPTFSLRPKMSCSAQAAGVDNGATDSLRRLLHLP